MTIDRQHGRVIFVCDSCEDTRKSDNEFEIAWKSAKEDGWKAKKIGNDWFHTCPDCEL